MIVNAGYLGKNKTQAKRECRNFADGMDISGHLKSCSDKKSMPMTKEEVSHYLTPKLMLYLSPINI